MTAPTPAPGSAPGLMRRLACFLYEGVLLFGIVMAAGFVYAIATGQRNALVGQHGLQLSLFVVLGAYFAWFWSHSGQTLAMQTWHIRLVGRDGGRVSALRASARYLCAYLWFMPALVSVRLAGLSHSGGATFGALAIGVLAYAALAWLHPQRQYWHDAVCGTRLVTWKPQVRN